MSNALTAIRKPVVVIPYPVLAEGRLLLTFKRGCVVHSETLSDQQHVLTLDSFFELAARAGYLVLERGAA